MPTATEVKERPIIMTGESVRAIIEGRKKQTRRVMKVQPTSCGEGFLRPLLTSCPYGWKQERLWVRETWITGKSLDRMNVKQIVKSSSEAGFSPGAPIWYVADGAYQAWGDNDERDFNGKGRIRPSIFMPRWASRLTLELVDVRVERLQDISEADAKAEGIHEFKLPNGPVYGYDPKGTPGKMVQDTAKDAFAMLWESINFKRGYGWKTNPWIWIIQFKKLESNL